MASCRGVSMVFAWARSMRAVHLLLSLMLASTAIGCAKQASRSDEAGGRVPTTKPAVALPARTPVKQLSVVASTVRLPDPPLAAVPFQHRDVAAAAVVPPWALGPLAAKARAVPESSNDDPALGLASAPVTAIVFGDVQCPFTARALSTLRAIQTRYGDDTLRVVWKNYPLAFHRRARPVAEAAHAVYLLRGGEAFWTFLEEVVAPSSILGDAELAQLAQGLDVPTSTYAYLLGAGKGELREKIDRDRAMAEETGVSGVPHVFINGESLEGAQPASVYIGAIEVSLSAGR